MEHEPRHGPLGLKLLARSLSSLSRSLSLSLALSLALSSLSRSLSSPRSLALSLSRSRSLALSRALVLSLALSLSRSLSLSLALSALSLSLFLWICILSGRMKRHYSLLGNVVDDHHLARMGIFGKSKLFKGSFLFLKYTILFKSLETSVFDEVSYAYQCCICLIKYAVHYYALLQFEIRFLFECLMQSIVFSVTWFFRNHSNMLICCSIIIDA